MKILFPVEVFYPSQAGGAANSVHYFTKHLDPSRFEKTVVATDKGLPAEVERNKWRETDDGRVMFVRTRSLRFPIRAAWRSLRNIRNADVVHLSSLYFPTAFISAIAAYLLKKK
jgi:hypothetical protein